MNLSDAGALMEVGTRDLINDWPEKWFCNRERCDQKKLESCDESLKDNN